MKNYLAKLGALLITFLILHLPAQAQGMPEITPSLKKMLGALPIADLKDDVEKMVGSLKKTSCANLSGCYGTKSGVLQLYFFTSNNAQQTFLLVINKKMAMPKLLKDNVQKVLGGTSLSDLIISISTTDIDLDITKMPADLQKIVRDSYFNVNSLTFASGVQLAARADLGGVMKITLQSMGVKTDQLTLRAGVVLPIPTDMVAGAGAGAGLADAMKHSNTMKKAGADALRPESYIEFQLAPDSSISMNVPKMTLTDTTIFIDNELNFGYKGNARFAGTSKDILLHFQTPLNPKSGVMDLLNFSFRMAMPQNFTLQDQALMSVAMAMPDTGMAASAATAALTNLGGGFIGNINAIKKPLLTVTKPLSVFQLRNPKPAAPYKFGDRTKPFPTTDEPFNVILLGPLEDGGPLLYVNSGVNILGQPMGKIEVSVGKAGFHGTVSENISIKLGPLGKTKIKMLAKADITSKMQEISLKGNLAGQNLLIELAGDTLTIDFSASCVNPFEIKAKVEIKESMDIAQIFEGQGGASVDPSKLQNCIGKDLEAALNKIANEYKLASGYSVKEANAALNKIASDATAAANKAAKEAKDLADAETARATEAANKAAKDAKDAARNLANNSTSSASNALKDAGNAISGVFGKKKKRSDENDKFDKSVFNWDYYYDTRGAAWGNTDLVQYWADHGFANAERGSYEFDLKYFRSQHRGASDKDLLNYWLGDGIDRGEQSSPDFSLKAFVSRYPNGSYRENLDWWFEKGGVNSGLNGRP